MPTALDQVSLNKEYFVNFALLLINIYMTLRPLFALTLWLFGTLLLYAQENRSVFNFLSLPNSAHVTALGGKNISLVEDDASLSFQNPALLSSVSNNSLALNFLSYMQGAKSGSASFTHIHRERGTWGVNAQFASYGTIMQTDEIGNDIGKTHPLDFALSGLYSYALSDYLCGGVAGKLIYSYYAGYTSFAMAVDLGVNYYQEESEFSFSIVAQNLGGQLKAFAEKREPLPFNLALGITKQMAHAPLRFNLTMSDLTHWSRNYYYHTGNKPKAGRILLNHLCLGVDIVPTQRFYAALGWDFRRAYEMKVAGKGKMAGLSLGAGLRLKRFQVGLAYAKYHLSTPTFCLSLGTSLQDK